MNNMKLVCYVKMFIISLFIHFLCIVIFAYAGNI